MTKKKICVVTGTRAEYGLLTPILKKIKKSKSLHLQIIATTSHLSEDFGLTYKEIEKDFVLDDKINNLLPENTKSSVAKSTGLAIVHLADSFEKLKPDVVLLLGDRFETHGAATAAMLMNIPIAHIHGGEITEGAIDEKIRHSITKMSFLHFCATEVYRKRIIQMGESPSRVFNSGAPGIDNIYNLKLESKTYLEKYLKWKLPAKCALFTYHPVTIFNDQIEKDLDLIFDALINSGIGVLFTYANADEGGAIINKKLKEFSKQNPKNYRVEKSLGQLMYLTAMKHLDLVIGNSSSGIIEAASFNKPVINIGKRQSGRIQGINIINSEISELNDSINIATSKAFSSKCKNAINVYGDGNAASVIVKELVEQKFLQLKKFHNIEFNNYE